MAIQSGVHYYLKVKKMTKILTLEIVGCWDCPYLDIGWCNHPKGDGFVEEDKIPEWCPLEEKKIE